MKASLLPHIAGSRSRLLRPGAIFLRWHPLGTTRCASGRRRRICLRAACGSIWISFNSSAIAARLLVHLLCRTLSIGSGYASDKSRCRHKHGDRLHCVSSLADLAFQLAVSRKLLCYWRHADGARSPGQVLPTSHRSRCSEVFPYPGKQLGGGDRMPRRRQ